MKGGTGNATPRRVVASRVKASSLRRKSKIITPALPARSERIEAMSPRQVLELRQLLWTNLLRETLSALCMETERLERARRDGAEPDGGAHPLDGHVALMTATGERIQVAGVKPAMQFAVARTAHERQVAMALDSTIFQIRTPAGDIFTLPVSEVTGIHGLSDSIMRQLQAAERPSDEGQEAQPFGFAAYTSVARGSEEPPSSEVMPAAPIDPIE